ncbi:T9SS type A sorting domain-containing protein [Portibacter marinus]|uniref:T9SS type A sorting domain-containing protein n=1 Tax=Portibacter marinus TaxID=2898660 RepID=UPI001F4674D9|nr:T9SS type A sorting domain-containing protein [Portibacter marinus]
MELISSASAFEENMYFTIGESFVQFMQDDELAVQEGFLQTSLLQPYSTFNPEVDKDEEPDKEFKIYPNPTLGKVSILLPHQFYEKSLPRYSIFNSQGKLCAAGSFQLGQKELKMDELPNGLYVIYIYNTTNHLTSLNKIVKQ